MNAIILMSVTVVLLVCVTYTQHQKAGSGNKPPTIQRFESSDTALILCFDARVFCPPENRHTVTLSVSASDPEKDELTYRYSTTAGEVLGQGRQVTWKFDERSIGSQIATVRVADSKGNEAVATLKVVGSPCLGCVIGDPPCPVVSVSSFYKVAHRGERVFFDVDVSNGYFMERPDYIWTVEGGKVVKGQHTPRIEIEATGEIGSQLTATVSVSGFDASCTGNSASGTLPVKP